MAQRGKKKKGRSHRQTRINTIKRKSRAMWVNIRRRRGENSPQRKSGIICRETVYVFQKRQLLLHKCCLRSNHRPASWRHLKSEPDIPPLPPAGGRPEAHSSIGNLKKPGGEKSERFWLLLCREDSSLNSTLKGTLFSNA